MIDRSMKDHPVYIKARIGRKDAICFVDTGSEKCVITRKLVDEAAMEPAGCRLFAANGTTINVVGEIILNAQLIFRSSNRSPPSSTAGPPRLRHPVHFYSPRYNGLRHRWKTKLFLPDMWSQTT